VMAEATLRHGYAYFGVADHSKSAHYAGGLSVEEIFEQHAEIDSLNEHYGERFRIFKGIESDILPDGSLDYPDDTLGALRFCRGERAQPIQAGSQGANGSDLAGHCEPSHDNTGTHVWSAAAPPAWVRY
jgi:hypothetical protein